MNLRKFKEEVRTWENCEENFSSFRTWAENSYELFKKELELDIADKDKSELGYREDFEDEIKYKWGELNITFVINLYSKIGWKIDDLLKNKEVSENYKGCNHYYDCRLEDIMEKLKEVGDIEFCYAILYLVRQIDKSSKIYTIFIRQILMGLKEYNLDECLSMVKSKKAFVAMWFADSMKKARSRITSAINDCGYEAMLIDLKEHNNQIVPEIFKEIDDSEFVVADLTGQRGGVYYEAGYAMAKGKTVILSCKDEEETHFDVAQINTIYWKDEQDLYNRLMKRIEATIGRKS